MKIDSGSGSAILHQRQLVVGCQLSASSLLLPREHRRSVQW